MLYRMRGMPNEVSSSGKYLVRHKKNLAAPSLPVPLMTTVERAKHNNSAVRGFEIITIQTQVVRSDARTLYVSRNPIRD
jgi:hypothetical protein